MGHRDYYRPSFSYGSWSNVVKYLVIINIAVFFLQGILEYFFGDSIYLIFGLIPKYVVGKLFLWQLLTYMFLHGGFFHLLINSFVLYMFGKPLEQAWGSKKFLRYYLICGIGAGIFITLTSIGNSMPTIGASGAVYGLLAAYGLTFPETYVYLYFLFPIKAKYFVVILGVIAFLSGVTDRGSLISHFGHFGGLIVGFAYLRFSEIMNFFRYNLKPGSSGARSKHGRVYNWRGNEYSKMKPTEENVNRILEKILDGGIESLTPEERKIMNEYTSRGN